MEPVTAGPGSRDGAPLRIAYVLGTTAGGTGPHVAMLAQGCAARGMAVRVFGPAETGHRYFPGPRDPGGQDPGGQNRGMGGSGDSPALTPGFSAVAIGDRPRPGHDLAAVLRLRRLLRAWAPDVVHAHGLRAGAFAALAGGPGALVVTVHNAPPAGTPARVIHAGLERLTARRADAVTWVSGDLGARMRRAGARDAGRAVVAVPAFSVPSADQVAAARASLGDGGRPAVFAAGRLTAQKGFDVLIDAAARWQGRRPVPVLAIAGEGPLAGELGARAGAVGVPVRFLGRRADVPALMAAADVVVVPSRWEGQPLVVQEALRAGRPVVASRVGGIPGLTGEDGALLVPPGDATALAGAVLTVLDDRAAAARLGAAATERARALPDVGDAVDSAVALYARVRRSAASRTVQKMRNHS
jgi:glycosyltransferase involved in cell wall biosynthesis